MTFLTHPAAEPTAEEQTELREHEADFTPYPIAKLCLMEAAKRVTFSGALHVLDPSAGAGVWLQAAREVLDVETSVGVDIRESEREHLERNADHAVIGDYMALERHRGAYHVAVANPPFSLFFDFCSAMMVEADHAWVYAPIDPHLRSADGVEAMRELAPHVDRLLIVPGPVNFRGPGKNPKTGKPWGSDFRTYGLWMLTYKQRPHGIFNGPALSWKTEVLRMPPAAHRKWTVRPGTEVRT